MRASGFETIWILDRDVPLENKLLPVTDLKLDPENPRIRHLLVKNKAEKKSFTEKEIEEFLWDKDEAVKRVYSSIVTSGISEALFVTHSGKVMEGNERLVSLRKIKEKIDQGGQFSDEDQTRLQELVENVPVKVLPRDLTETEKDVLLARMHVSGKDPWDAQNAAAHLYKMHSQDGLTHEQIAQLLARTRQWVAKKLHAYEWTEEYLKVHGYENIRDYSYFEEAYKSKSRLKKAGLDLETQAGMDQFHEIIQKRLLPRGSLNMSKLPKLWANDETRELLLNGKGDEALSKLELVDPSEFSSRFRTLMKARDQLGKLDRDDLEMIEKDAKFRQILEDISNEISDILNRQTTKP